MASWLGHSQVSLQCLAVLFFLFAPWPGIAFPFENPLLRSLPACHQSARNRYDTSWSCVYPLSHRALHILRACLSYIRDSDVVRLKVPGLGIARRKRNGPSWNMLFCVFFLKCFFFQIFLKMKKRIVLATMWRYELHRWFVSSAIYTHPSMP